MQHFSRMYAPGRKFSHWCALVQKFLHLCALVRKFFAPVPPGAKFFALVRTNAHYSKKYNSFSAAIGKIYMIWKWNIYCQLLSISLNWLTSRYIVIHLHHFSVTLILQIILRFSIEDNPRYSNICSRRKVPQNLRKNSKFFKWRERFWNVGERVWMRT